MSWHSSQRAEKSWTVSIFPSASYHSLIPCSASPCTCQTSPSFLADIAIEQTDHFSTPLQHFYLTHIQNKTHSTHHWCQIQHEFPFKMIHNNDGKPLGEDWWEEHWSLGMCPGRGLWDLSFSLFLFLFTLFLPDLWWLLLSHEVPLWYVILSKALHNEVIRSWTKTYRTISQDNRASFLVNCSVIVCEHRKLALPRGCSFLPTNICSCWSSKHWSPPHQLVCRVLRFLNYGSR